MVDELAAGPPRDLDAEIAQLQQGVERARARLPAIRQEFAAAAVAFYHAWYWQRTETAVFEHPDVTRGLGRERLSQLKAAVRALQEGLPVRVAEAFPETLWATEAWHPQESPRAIERATPPLAEPLYQILVDFGYERYHGRKVAGPRPNEPMERLLGEYTEQAGVAAGQERRLRQLLRDKEQAAAKERERQEIAELWNSA